MTELNTDNIEISEASQTEDAQPAVEEPNKGYPSSESREFKLELLSRLPTLAASKWEASETLNIYQDLQKIVDLDADAFLAPLEQIAEKHHD